MNRSEHVTGNELVVVVGSANLDLVVSVEHLPGPGETVIGHNLAEIAGGKGLNQAVAAAQLTRTVLLAAVGDDDVGQVLRDALRRKGVDESELVAVNGISGRAFITVDNTAENQIVVFAAANSFLSASHVHRALRRLSPAVVVVQSEITCEAERAAAEWAELSGARLVWNASPAREPDGLLLAMADPIVVNMGEAASLARNVPYEYGKESNLISLLASRSRSAVISLGANGAEWAKRDHGGHVPAPAVVASDTTGAGDHLVGVLAAHLALGNSLGESVTLAVQSAARLVGLPRPLR